MRKPSIVFAAIIGLAAIVFFTRDNLFSKNNKAVVIEGTADEEGESEEENDGYDEAAARMQWEYDRIKDPATGKVPYDQLWEAIKYTKNAKSSITFRTQAFSWQERGPVYDSVGPSGNRRGSVTNTPGTYTAGRIRAVMVDASDPTGNTVWCGGVAGGLWKCTNFLSSAPDWISINDNFLNMAVSSICQNPSNPSIMYFSTGEPTSNADAVLGLGIWKSTDNGATWTQLSSTTSFTRIFKVQCDADGNLYMAARTSGLRRSTNGGTSFTIITPTGVTSDCTDFEIASTGRMHASFGYTSSSSGTAANHRYTDNPTSVTTSTWSASTGLPTGTATANRIELTTSGNTVYAITTNGSNNIYATWQSTDGGATFIRMNAVDYTSDLTNTQGWYDITLAVNPSDASHIIMGGLNLYQSITGGAVLTKVSYWVNTNPYVHADQHNTIWYNNGAESRLIVACDGGLYYSNNAGVTWTDRNKNLGLKQFYSCATRPEAGSNYIIAGAQDNGVHRINMPGKTYSFEVTGGDGGFVDISQTNPNIQFGSYIYNQYRRSINGGNNWSSVNFSNTIGQFINPFDYDELSDAVYGCYGSNTLIRWNSASSGNTSNTFTVTGLGNSSAVTASPYTLGTLYAGGTGGTVVKITDANTTVTTAASTSIRDLSMSGVVSCINVGSTDDALVVTMSSYGVNNVWYSINGGTSWSQVDGNLPNMPVRWAVFPKGVDNRLIIATEAGVYVSGVLNGASTVWTPSLGFPTVRTDMLRIRASDNTIIAATHARGIWQANVLQVLPVRGLELKGSITSGQSNLNWTSPGATAATRFHIQFSKDGINFSDIGETSASENKFTHLMPGIAGYYRVVADEAGIAPVVSNIVLLRNTSGKGLQLNLAPNPVRTSATLLISGADNGTYQWEIITVAGQVMQKGNGSSQRNTTHSLPLNLSSLPTGSYWIRFIQGKSMATIPFIKQ